MKILINETNDKIRYIAFKSFLEKGYESTNIRDICKEVGIKASSLYFYYKSKEELFFSIYDEIYNEVCKCFLEIDEFEDAYSPEVKLYCIYKRLMNHTNQDIVKQKFLVRYLFFPTEEIANLLRERYQYWRNKDNMIILKLFNWCIEKGTLDGISYDYMHKYNKFLDTQIIGMIISNIKTNELDLDLEWIKFWNLNILK